MTLNTKNPRAKQRWTLLIGAVAAMTLLLAGIALAVHDLKFQLDGDVSASTTTNVGGNLQPFDWDSFFNTSGAKSPVLPDASRPGFTASAFTRDFNTVVNRKGATVFSTFDATTFTTGSKDTLDINPGWQCATSNNVLSKNDIMNAYTLAYTDPNTGHQILYFGMERNSNNGDANVAFWFLQDSTVGCDDSGGTATWSGHHVDGDILIVSAFTNGGGVSGIDAYRWNGGATGSLGTTSVAHGADCYGTSGLDAICATTNGGAAGAFNSPITTPWLTADATSNVGHSLQPSEFFEGGIDLTAKGLGGKCFNTFVGDTRSSQSLTATIFDYALGTLGECTSTTATTPVDATDTSQPPATSIPGDPADAVVTVKDKTVITVTGLSTFTGSISWHICGPTATTSTATCDTAGVDLGSQGITTAGTYYSPTATLTAAGRYCFRAEFSGDTATGVPPSSDHSLGECFTISPRQPTLTTQATTGPVAFGQKISDTVTLANTAHEPGTGGPAGSLLAGSINPTTLGGDATGNITVVAYGPDSCSTTAFTSAAIAASGNGSYGGAGTAFEFTPLSPGQYVFVAAYAGDLPNTLSIAASACSGAPASEKVTVQQIPTQISTTQKVTPQDSATITSSATADLLPAGGTVTFYLYAGDTAANNLANCQAHGTTVGSGGLVDKELFSTNSTPAHTETFNTSNTVAVSANTTVYWRVTYATGDQAHTGIQSDCAESTATTFVNDSGPGTSFP